MHRRTSLIAALAALLAGAAPAAAKTVTVTVGPGGSLSYSPANAAITVGDTVHWVWGSSPHSTTSGPATGTPDGLWDSAIHSTPFSFDRTFTATGTFHYFCRVHVSFGMTGTITVKPIGIPPPPTKPKITGATISPARFCLHKSSKCRHPGSRLRFKLNEVATVSARVTRLHGSSRVLKRITFNGRNGKNSFRFGPSGLAPGHYVLTLIPKSPAGVKGSSVKKSFVVVRS
jgi:plastocyanin